MKLLRASKRFAWTLALLLAGCVSVSIHPDDRERVDTMNQEIGRLNTNLELYKKRIDDLTAALIRLEVTLRLLSR